MWNCKWAMVVGEGRESIAFVSSLVVCSGVKRRDSWRVLLFN